MFEALLILAATAPMQAADPLAEARAGKIQCVNANTANKTCMAISTYTLNKDGSYETATTLLIAPQPLITMTVKSAGIVKDGALCGPVRKADFAAATLEMDGAPVNEAMASAIRAQVLGSVEAMDGKMGCGTEAADGTVTVTLDGVAHPEMTQKALWVRPDEGYKVGQ
jgi:hypothetical protein